MNEEIKDIIEILELAKEEIENNNENITATLDLQDLKSLKKLYDLYNKEKEKNKKAIDFINERKKTVNKDMAEGTGLQVGTFMWQVDELLEILKGVEED